MMLNSIPTFTIITVTKNNITGLKRTSASIKKQTFKDFEWIVQDNLSTDGSLELLNEMNLTNLQVYSEGDQGLYDAMNKAMTKAKGKYVIFMNGGDEIYNTNLLKDLSIYSKNFLFIYGDSYDRIKNKCYKKKSKNITQIKNGMFTHHQSMFYDLEIIKKYNLTYNLEYKIASDYDFTSRYLSLINFNQTIYFNDYPVCVFDEPGISSFSYKSLTEYNRVKKTLHKTSQFEIYLTSILIFIIVFVKRNLFLFYKLYRYKK